MPRVIWREEFFVACSFEADNNNDHDDDDDDDDDDHDDDDDNHDDDNDDDKVIDWGGETNICQKCDQVYENQPCSHIKIAFALS